MAAGRFAFILAPGIGHAYVDKTVAIADVEAFMGRVLAERLAAIFHLRIGPAMHHR